MNVEIKLSRISECTSAPQLWELMLNKDYNAGIIIIIPIKAINDFFYGY